MCLKTAAPIKLHVGSQVVLARLFAHGFSLWNKQAGLRDYEVQCTDEGKRHAEISQGQSEVKLLRNALWQPTMVGRTLTEV